MIEEKTAPENSPLIMKQKYYEQAMNSVVDMWVEVDKWPDDYRRQFSILNNAGFPAMECFNYLERMGKNETV